MLYTCRFVNHITERSQVKLKIQPVHILAREVRVNFSLVYTLQIINHRKRNLKIIGHQTEG